ncbi:sensor histidine kinase [Acetobacterium wieringae]|uniref:sensor histidine kinase n=1 Tax=Acetobacterium wieringae TaxID=52694 RepID=UPI0026F07197|nr:histidine kinase [Acetobacterium wieringae]
MVEKMKENYSAMIKFSCLTIMLAYVIVGSEKSLQAISLECFLLGLFLMVATLYELLDKEKIGCLLAEIILAIVIFALFLNSSIGFYLIPVVVLDTVGYFKLPLVVGLMAFAGVFFNPPDLAVYMIFCIFISVIYFQNQVMIKKYQDKLENYEQEEFKLKDSISDKDLKFKKKLEQNSLHYKNQMLEERARIYQALHDKLGHSINGSVYQLEASKVLIHDKPDESTRIIQAVIDTLRESMDEIRFILRKEKPDRKKAALLQLHGLCEECREKYGIQATLLLEGEDKEIPDHIWEVILDNAIEAVSNALKYAKCSRLAIELMVMNKIVRCSIYNNGASCETIVEGMGIQGMKDRIRKVNGLIDIDGQNGFRINMIFPLTSVEERGQS